MRNRCISCVPALKELLGRSPDRPNPLKTAYYTTTKRRDIDSITHTLVAY